MEKGRDGYSRRDEVTIIIGIVGTTRLREWHRRKTALGMLTSLSQRIVSAPYTDSESSVHEWDLGRPSDIIALYLHIRNLDEWVANGFAARVETGIERLACSVKKGKEVDRKSVV